jgi:hypothetical protein
VEQSGDGDEKKKVSVVWKEREKKKSEKSDNH